MFTIGQVAAATELSPKAIRLYEADELITPERTEAGYRLYRDEDLAVLHFVRQARVLGLGLADIKAILDLQRGGQQPCDLVMGILDERIAAIDRTVADLQALRAALTGARDDAERAALDGEDAVVCRIIEHAAPPKA